MHNKTSSEVCKLPRKEKSLSFVIPHFWKLAFLISQRALTPFTDSTVALFSRPLFQSRLLTLPWWWSCGDFFLKRLFCRYYHVIINPSSHAANKTHLSQESISKWMFLSLVLRLPPLFFLTYPSLITHHSSRVTSHKLKHEAFGQSWCPLGLDTPQSGYCVGLRDQEIFTTSPVVGKNHLH